MKIIAAVGVCFWGIAAAQSLSGLPSCAQSCINNGLSSSGCNSVDIKCICSTNAFLSSVTSCVTAACSAADLQQTVTYANQLCAAAGVTVSVGAGSATSSSPASGSSVPTSSAGTSSKTSSAGSSSRTSSTFSTSTTPTGSSTNSASSAGGSSKTSSSTSESSGAQSTSNSSGGGSNSGNGNNHAGGLSTGAKVGIGVGVPLGLALFGGLIWLWLRERTKRKGLEGTRQGGATAAGANLGNDGRHELSGNAMPPKEVPGDVAYPPEGGYDQTAYANQGQQYVDGQYGSPVETQGQHPGYGYGYGGQHGQGMHELGQQYPHSHELGPGQWNGAGAQQGSYEMRASNTPFYEMGGQQTPFHPPYHEMGDRATPYQEGRH